MQRRCTVISILLLGLELCFFPLVFIGKNSINYDAYFFSIMIIIVTSFVILINTLIHIKKYNKLIIMAIISFILLSFVVGSIDEFSGFSKKTIEISKLQDIDIAYTKHEEYEKIPKGTIPSQIIIGDYNTICIDLEENILLYSSDTATNIYEYEIAYKLNDKEKNEIMASFNKFILNMPEDFINNESDRFAMDVTIKDSTGKVYFISEPSYDSDIKYDYEELIFIRDLKWDINDVYMSFIKESVDYGFYDILNVINLIGFVLLAISVVIISKKKIFILKLRDQSSKIGKSIRERGDSEFKEDEFKSFVENSYYELMHAMSEKNDDKLKSLLSDTLITPAFNKLNEWNDCGKKYVFISGKLNNCKMISRDASLAREDIQVLLSIDSIDYICKNTESSSDRFLNKNRKDMIITLSRLKGNKTSKNKKTLKCPNCGANVSGEKCEYCNTIISAVDGWFILNIKYL